ncbi:LysR substrate-binding domain-containing protein [Chitinasiproducens palmae]|nr:LysR substrate-binding domain-containing protein [Chitinasiproducens palmae]
MKRDLDLDLLRTFVTVADNGSMTVAANLLHRTQGAVSQQIKRLETALTCTLFVRGSRGLSLSREGEQLLEKARQLLRMNDEIWAERAEHPFTGMLRIGVPYDLVNSLAPTMRSFADAHPLVDISLTCGASPDLSQAVDDGRLDVSLVEYPEFAADGETLRIEPLIWVSGRHSNASRKRPLPLSMVDERCAFRPVVLGALSDAGIPWRTVFESGSIEATAATVRAGLAITTWLRSTVPSDLETLDPQIAGLPPLPAFSISLRTPPATTAAAMKFSRLLRESFSAATRLTPITGEATGRRFASGMPA